MIVTASVALTMYNHNTMSKKITEIEIYQILANTFRNGNHYDYVDWYNADNVTIDGTYDLEILADDITRYINQSRISWLRSEIERVEEEMKPKREYGDVPPSEAEWNSGFDYGFNTALTSIITRYKEELLELDRNGV